MAAEKTWIILTSGEEPIPKVLDKLKQTGFTVESSLEAIGQIIGKGSEDVKEKVLAIKGVTDIYPSHDDINIGPPGLETW